MWTMQYVWCIALDTGGEYKTYVTTLSAANFIYLILLYCNIACKLYSLIIISSA